MLDEFLADNLRRCDGHRVLFKDARKKYLETLPLQDRYLCTPGVFSTMIRARGYVTGYAYGNRTWIINVSSDVTAQPLSRFILVGDRRIRREGHYV